MEKTQKERTAMRLLLLNAGNLVRALEDLSPLEKRVLVMRFGLEPATKEHTLEEIGFDFDATRENIRKVETQAIDTLLSKYGTVAKKMAELASKPKRKTKEEKLLFAIFGREI
jgi:DNA-directed RNA polymerase sigma subunit (sigma70/sigma32)